MEFSSANTVLILYSMQEALVHTASIWSRSSVPVVQESFNLVEGKEEYTITLVQAKIGRC